MVEDPEIQRYMGCKCVSQSLESHLEINLKKFSKSGLDLEAL